MPVLRSEVSEDARTDLALQYGWYAQGSGKDIAERYLEAFARTAELLFREPGAGVRRFRSPRLKGIHSLQQIGNSNTVPDRPEPTSPW